MIPDMSAPVGRKRINAEKTMARFRAGTLDAIKPLLLPKEKQADFIREAVEREIKRRGKSKKSLP